MPEAPFLPLLTFLRRVVAVAEPPRCELDPALLVLKEGVGVILQDPDLIPPLLPVEVRAQAVICAG